MKVELSVLLLLVVLTLIFGMVLRMTLDLSREMASLAGAVFLTHALNAVRIRNLEEKVDKDKSE